MVEISSWCLVKILKMKFDQDLRFNLRYDFGKMNSTLGSVVPLAMFIDNHWLSLFIIDYQWLSVIIIDYHWLSENLKKVNHCTDSLTHRLTTWIQELRAHQKVLKFSYWLALRIYRRRTVKSNLYICRYWIWEIFSQVALIS